MITKLLRRQMTLMFLGLWVIGASFSLAQAAEPSVHVSKTATCGCCKIWVDYMRKQGFSVTTRNMTAGQLARVKMERGIRPQFASCHTARVGKYTVEGHVPAREVRRLLGERPDVIGLSVPGMPLGSPGMDFGSEREPYDVLLIKKDGSSSVYASYGKKN